MAAPKLPTPTYYLQCLMISLPVVAKPAARTDWDSDGGLMHRACIEQGHAEGLAIQKLCGYCHVVVPKEDQVKAYPNETGGWSILADEEIKAAAGEKNKALAVQAVVPLDAVSPAFYKAAHYLSPVDLMTGGPVYRMIGAALTALKSGAVATYMGRVGNDKLGLIRPYGDLLVLHELFPAEDQRAYDTQFKVPLPTGTLSDRDLGLATQVFDTLKAEWNPALYPDTRRDRIRALIQAKATGESIVPAEITRPLAPSMDLTALLQASLSVAAGRKPAAAIEPETPAPAAAKKGRKSA